jgi:hypothetical protein
MGSGKDSRSEENWIGAKDRGKICIGKENSIKKGNPIKCE